MDWKLNSDRVTRHGIPKIPCQVFPNRVILGIQDCIALHKTAS
jgi:hypothetical protein